MSGTRQGATRIGKGDWPRRTRNPGGLFAERLPASLLFTGSRYRQLDDLGAKFRFIE